MALYVASHYKVTYLLFYRALQQGAILSGIQVAIPLGLKCVEASRVQ